MTATLLSPTRPTPVRQTIDVEPAPLPRDTAFGRYGQAGVRPPAPGYRQARLAVDFRTREHDPHFGPQATLSSDLPDPTIWSTRLLSLALECMAGSRQPRQLVRWFTPECHALIARRHAATHRRGRAAVQPPRIRRLRAFVVCDGVAEISAVVLLDGRPRAVAMRLNGADGRWLATELIIG